MNGHNNFKTIHADEQDNSSGTDPVTRIISMANGRVNAFAMAPGPRGR